MSKRALKKYLEELPKEELEKQVLDLYTRFKEVKTFYNFVFNPKEDKLLDEAKQKVYKEFFPDRRKRPKARRSVAQKIVKHWNQIGVESNIIAEFMLFYIETTILFSEEGGYTNEAFFKSIYKSFEELVRHITVNNLKSDHSDRIEKIIERVKKNNWLDWDLWEFCWNN